MTYWWFLQNSSVPSLCLLWFGRKSMVLFLIRFLGSFQKGKVSLYIGSVKNTQPHSHPERQRKHFFALNVTGSVGMPSHIQARKQASLRVCGRTEEGPGTLGPHLKPTQHGAVGCNPGPGLCPPTGVYIACGAACSSFNSNKQQKRYLTYQ